MIKEAIEKVKNKENLSICQMQEVFTEVMSGKAQTDLIADFLLALKEKKETVEEITGAALIMRKFAIKVSAKKKNLIDTCGTGGDNSHTFNISTVSAFVACGAGCVVAKHGNKSISSKCGSADLLTELGVNINIDKEMVEKCIDEIGIGFLFAPRLHLAMKYAMPARQKIKTRSIFNILGPLTNPAGAKRQILGVFSKELISPIINVLKNLGSLHAIVLHGRDGLDEITTTEVTDVAELKDGDIKFYEINPEEYGIALSRKEDLNGGDSPYNAKIAMDILSGQKGPKRDIVLMNAGCAIYISDIARDIKEGIKMAGESIDSGQALKSLEKLKALTNET